MQPEIVNFGHFFLKRQKTICELYGISGFCSRFCRPEKLLPEKNAKILDFHAEHDIMGWIIEWGMVPVNCEIAIFDLKGALAPQDKPLMLQPVLFCPVLTWAAQELMDCGVQRLYVRRNGRRLPERRRLLPCFGRRQVVCGTSGILLDALRQDGRGQYYD